MMTVEKSLAHIAAAMRLPLLKEARTTVQQEEIVHTGPDTRVDRLVQIDREIVNCHTILDIPYKR